MPRAAKLAGRSAGEWARAHGIDGRSLNAWKVNLARRGTTAAPRRSKPKAPLWPYLIVNEADVPLDAAQLRAAGVKAVALIAGENGSQVGGERRTADKLTKQGFPARLWVMKGAGHHYSADIDTIMAEALVFVLAEGLSPDGGAAR